MNLYLEALNYIYPKLVNKDGPGQKVIILEKKIYSISSSGFINNYF